MIETMTRHHVTTSREGASLIRTWARRSGGRIASAYVYEAAQLHTRLTRRQVARALQMSGLYPVRLAHNRVVWSISKPRPWDPDRELGSVPKPRTERCYGCGRRYQAPSRTDAEWP